MTQQDYNNLVISMQYEHSKLSKEITNKIRLGLQYLPEHLSILYQLTLYIDVLENYTLVASTETDPNYFTPTEMIELLNYINSLLRTVYNADFTLN